MNYITTANQLKTAANNEGTQGSRSAKLLYRLINFVATTTIFTITINYEPVKALFLINVILGC